MCLQNARRRVLRRQDDDRPVDRARRLKVALLSLVALHVLAVPFHRIALGNNVMRRMTRLAA